MVTLTPKRLSDLSPKQYKEVLSRGSGVLDESLPAVIEIVEAVRDRGDSALIEYTERFDGVLLSLSEIRISHETILKAAASVDKKILLALQNAADHIRTYHRPQVPQPYNLETVTGVEVGRRIVPFDRVGVYVPGGKAPYPSSLLMGAIPALVAGVPEVVVCTPPPVSPVLLGAVQTLGIDEVYQVGGAQAIAALAYGTPSLRSVDKIVGPGNRYVTSAKDLVRHIVAIDLPAGPSEVAIIGEPLSGWSLEKLSHWIGADLAAQLEHGPDSSALFLTSSVPLAEAVVGALTGQVGETEQKYIAVLLTESIEESIAFVDEYAPEHLEIITEDPKSILKQVRNVGSAFLGPFSPVAVGDYCSGTNHILPTMGAARRFSGLGVKDFLKEIAYQELTQEGLESLRQTVSTLAGIEGFGHHKRSVEIRLTEEGEGERERERESESEGVEKGEGA